MGDSIQKICNINVHLPREYLLIYKKRRTPSGRAGRAAGQGRRLDETSGDEHVTADLHWLYSRMTGEYARYNGHADTTVLAHDEL